LFQTNDFLYSLKRLWFPLEIRNPELSHEQIEFLHYIIEGNFFVFENKKAANSWFNTIAKIGEIFDKEQDYLNLEFYITSNLGRNFWSCQN
jgi:hypothetical protein